MSSPLAGHCIGWRAEPTAALLDRLVAPGGAILVCTSNSAPDGRNPWLEEYNRARRLWSGSAEGERYGHVLDTLLRGTRFRVGETIAVESTHEVRVTDLARRILTFSTSSPGSSATGGRNAARGRKASAFLNNVRAVHEVVVSTAQVAR